MEDECTQSIQSTQTVEFKSVYLRQLLSSQPFHVWQASGQSNIHRVSLMFQNKQKHYLFLPLALLSPFSSLFNDNRKAYCEEIGLKVAVKCQKDTQVWPSSHRHLQMSGVEHQHFSFAAKFLSFFCMVPLKALQCVKRRFWPSFYRFHDNSLQKVKWHRIPGGHCEARDCSTLFDWMDDWTENETKVRMERFTDKMAFVVTTKI